MPQPATHYLVTRRAIPKEHWEAWWNDEYKSYFGLGTAAPDLFYFPCFSKLGMVDGLRNDIDWNEIANPLHHSSSYDMFCNLLDNAKRNKNNRAAKTNHQFAFAFGYYCHVITDCIFHPYVYRSTKDHWNTPASGFNDKEHVRELMHKKQELAIDQGIYAKYYDAAASENFSRIRWQCPGEDQNLMEYGIANLFNETLLQTYPNLYSCDFSTDINDFRHPVQQAYLALSQVIQKLFEGEGIILFGSQKFRSFAQIRKKLPASFFVSPYPDCGELDTYTPEELFNFSCFVAREIFMLSLAFWEDGSQLSSKKFFEKSYTHYLNQGNWNLDTGLTCQFNEAPELRSDNKSFNNFHANSLKNMYRTFKEGYSSNFSS